jgi:septal ring factor EnvC (AmiA/AmiB activator)
VGLVASIEGRGSVATGFPSWRGRLPWPVAGGQLELGFGRQVDKRFGTVTVHKGIDIRALKGKPVKSVFAGQVVFAGTFRGYGLLVILDHGEGYYSLYAHLDSLAVKKGNRLRQGQVIGRVGETGSLKGAYLYFEIRQGGRAVDPQGWLHPGRM